MRLVARVSAGTVLLVVLLGSGCDGEQTCAALASVQGSAELGTGSATFRALVEGDDLEVTQGPQGGMHVWVSARFSGIMAGNPASPVDGTSPLLQIDVLSEESELLARSIRLGPLRLREDGTTERVGEIVPFVSGRIDDVTWRQAVVELSVLDSCGTLLTDSRQVRLTSGCSEEATD